jgi:hypothetical protein
MSSDSNAHEVLAHRDWYLLVGPPVTATLQNIRLLKSSPQLTAGNTPPVFIMSWISSGDVSDIDGRYGYVTMGSHFEFPQEALV